MEIQATLFYQDLLDDHDKKIYKSLIEQWTHLEPKLIIQLPHCPISEIICAAHYDYSTLFFVNFYRIVYSKNFIFSILNGDYLYNQREIKLYSMQCENWGKSIIAQMPARLGVNEKALWLHDVLIQNIRYGDSKGIRAHNIVGVIIDREAVCEGISMAYKFLCDLAHIPCVYVPGKLHNEPHGWNMIWTEQGPSFVDVTNDIRSNGKLSRTSFLMSSKDMVGYQWDTNKIPTSRITNAANRRMVAHNDKDVYSIVNNTHEKCNLTIYLEYERKLNHQELEALVRRCLMWNPQHLSRRITFSTDDQFLRIE